MAREIATGAQNFCKLREKSAFYVDKTAFIKEWSGQHADPGMK